MEKKGTSRYKERVQRERVTLDEIKALIKSLPISTEEILRGDFSRLWAELDQHNS